MAEKLSDKLKNLFKRTDVYLGKAIDRKPKSSTSIGPSQGQFKMYKAGQKTSKALSKIGLGQKAVPSSSKALVTAKTAAKFRKLAPLAKAARFARAATPIGLGVEAGILAYKVATRTPEQKARAKAIKTKLSKKSTKQSHADLLKMSIGGDTMLKGGQKKLDKNKDGKISGIDFKMMKANTGKMMNFKEFVKKESGAQVSKNELTDLKKKYLKKIRSAQVGPAEEMKLMGGKTDKKKDMKMFSGGAKKGKMMYASMGMEAKSTKGYGAARTSGMGLQDEQLPPGKTLDYYKDIM